MSTSTKPSPTPSISGPRLLGSHAFGGLLPALPLVAQLRLGRLLDNLDRRPQAQGDGRCSVGLVVPDRGAVAVVDVQFAGVADVVQHDGRLVRLGDGAVGECDLQLHMLWLQARSRQRTIAL